MKVVIFAGRLETSFNDETKTLPKPLGLPAGH